MKAGDLVISATTDMYNHAMNQVSETIENVKKDFDSANAISKVKVSNTKKQSNKKTVKSKKKTKK